MGQKELQITQFEEKKSTKKLNVATRDGAERGKEIKERWGLRWNKKDVLRARPCPVNLLAGERTKAKAFSVPRPEQQTEANANL